MMQINSTDELMDLAERAIKDPSLIEQAFEFGPDFSHGKLIIHLNGDRYDSTISTSVMRALLSLQEELYRIYALHKSDGSRLTQEERDTVEIMVSVKPGSTIIEVMENVLGVFTNMTGNQQVITIGILAAAVLISGIVKAVTSRQNSKDNLHTRMRELELAAKEREGYQQVYLKTISEVVAAQRDALKYLAREPFDSMDINGVPVTKEELHAAIAGHRSKREEEVIPYTGKFKILRIDVSGNGIFIDAVHLPTDTEILNINILAEYISSDNYQWIKDAVKDGKGEPVPMTVVRHMKGSVQEYAVLMSFSEEEP